MGRKDEAIGTFRAGYRTAVWWAIGVAAVIGVGLPLTIGLATRGMASRPPRPLRPGYGKSGQWLHEQYDLDWRACARIERAVAQGEQVGDPELEDAAHGLATLIVSGQAPGQRLLRIVGFSAMTAGAAVLITGIVAVALSHYASHLVFLLWYGPFMMIQAWVQTIFTTRIQRRKAARALELNHQAAPARLSFRAEDHESEVAHVILVTGATGNAGSEVARALAAAGHLVRALTRDPAAARLPAGVTAAQGDLTAPDTLGGAFDDVSAVFLLAGYPDAPGLLARMADAGVRRVVLLSSGAVVGGSLDNYVVRFNVVSEAAVRDSVLTWTVLRPSGFMSNALRWLPQLRDGDTVREPFADLPVAVIDPFDIGAVAALALTEEEHAGRSYRLTGPQALRPAERLAILGQVLGRDLRLVPQPDDEAWQAMSAAMPAPLVDSFFEFSRGRTYLDDQVTGTTEALLGRPPRTFRDWAHTHAGEFSLA